MLFGTTLASVFRVPPVAALVVYQPTKAWPALVGVGKVPNCDPGAKSEVEGDTVPPLAFHVMVMDVAVHLAQYVVLLLGIALVYVIRVPPVAASVVYHPTNACPALVGVGKVPNCDPGAKSEVEGDTEPPLAFHVMVTEAVVHLAQ